jgi:uncharacterized membrane protein YhaH (DUF805 family)
MTTDAAAGQAILLYLGVPFFLLHTGAHLVFAFRRFQDTGSSGWLALLVLIPGVAFFVGLYLLFCPGSTGRNQFGPAPAANTSGIVLAAIGLPLFIFVAMIAFVMFILTTFVAGVR